MQVVLALMLLVGAFSYFSEPSRYEAHIERVMRSLFPNAKSIQVRIKGSGGFAALRGEFDSLEITVVGAKAKSEALTQLIAHDEGNQAREKTTLLPTAVVGQTKRSVGHIASVMVKFSECEFDGVPFTELTVGLTNVRYDLQKLLSEQRIWLIDFANGWFVFKLPSSFVSSLIESEMTKSGLVKPVAKLHAQGIRVEASYPVWWLHIPFSVDGELVAVPPQPLSQANQTHRAMLQSHRSP